MRRLRVKPCLVCVVLLVLLASVPVRAEERVVLHFPVAIVNVNKDSYLNVRREPAGSRAYYGLPCRMDVVVLEQDNGWALVSTPDRMENGEEPFGWVSMDYLIIYRDYLVYPEEIGWRIQDESGVVEQSRTVVVRDGSR